MSVLSLSVKVLVGGGTKVCFGEKLLQASTVSDRANASQLQDRAAAGQS